MKGWEFSNLLLLMFLGADLLRLSRDDLIEICGLADGIRLNNALQAKWVAALFHIFLCHELFCNISYTGVFLPSDQLNFTI